MKNFSTEQSCCACGLTGGGFTCLHHVYTRKARPDLQYSAFNLMPVCLKCHNEIHAKGTMFMSEKYSGVKDWLLDEGWEVDGFLNKWFHNKALK